MAGWFRRKFPAMSPDDLEACANALLARDDLTDDDRHELTMALSAARMRRSKGRILTPVSKGDPYGESVEDVRRLWTRYFGEGSECPGARSSEGKTSRGFH